MSRYAKRFSSLLLILLFTAISGLPARADSPNPPILNQNYLSALRIVGVAARGLAYRAGWSPDSKIFAVASATGLWLYDSNFNSEADPVSGYVPVIDMGFSGDGKTIAWMSQKTEIGFWDVAHHRDLVPTEPDYSGPEIKSMFGMRLNSTGTLLITQNTFDTPLFWDVASGMVIGVGVGVDRRADIAAPERLAMSPDGKLAAQPVGKEVVVGIIARLDAQGYVADGYLTNSPATSAAFGPDSSVLAIGEQSGIINLANVKARNIFDVWQSDVGSITSLTFSPSGNLLLAEGDSGVLQLWDLKRQTSLYFNGKTGTLSDIAFSADGSKYILTRDGNVEVYDTLSGKLISLAPEASRPAFSPDAHLFTTISNGGVSIWDTATGKLRRALPGYNGEIVHMAYSHDGKLLGLAGKDGTVLIRSALNGEDVATLTGYLAQVNDVAFTPDDNSIIEGSADGIIRIWNFRNNTVTQLRQAYGRILALSLNDDGTQLASAGDDGLVIWDLATRTRTSISTNKYIGVVFRPHNKMLAALTAKGSVQIWATDPPKLLESYNGSAPDTTYVPDYSRGDTHDYPDRGLLAFSPDGNKLLYASRGDEDFPATTLHNMITGEDTGGPDGVGNLILHADFSSDSQLLISTVTNFNDEGDMNIDVMPPGISSPDEYFFEAPDSIWSRRALFSPDGAHIAMLTGGGAVWIWAAVPPEDIF